MLEFIKSKKEIIVQFIKFGIVGFLNTVLAYIITNGTFLLFQKTGILGNSITVISQTSNFITYVITVFISFKLNGKYVFGKDKEISYWKALLKVYASYAITGLLINGVLIYIEESVYSIPHYLATFINMFITVPLNFILNKFWAYK